MPQIIEICPQFRVVGLLWINPLVFTLQSLLGAFSRVFSGVCIFILNYLPYRAWLASQQTNFYSELSM